MNRTSCKFLKGFLRALLLVLFIRFLIVGLTNGRENGGRRILKHDDHVEVNKGRGKHIRALSKFELNYTNKRRIPNGPDPIHNRSVV
ncbi:hypothetical protein CDL12_12125 [Handroanthus impetiginosus]|uniref:CLAVATA3/ESR (CLE)-related protein 25 n=1 Tax=Handroanthus impetiginosus TaxID=429701 RepID=A0A2G9HCI3_9LAMI|nr:hypothetical protein CDL12_12125 [Handroanthus impetiginosus]